MKGKTKRVSKVVRVYLRLSPEQGSGLSGLVGMYGKKIPEVAIHCLLRGMEKVYSESLLNRAKPSTEEEKRA